MHEYGRRIKETRNESQLTQKDLARRTGLSSTTISRYENNSRVYSWETLKLIAIGLETSADYLLGITDIKTSVKELARMGEEAANERDLLERFGQLPPSRQAVLLEASAVLDIVGNKDEEPPSEAEPEEQEQT